MWVSTVFKFRLRWLVNIPMIYYYRNTKRGISWRVSCQIPRVRLEGTIHTLSQKGHFEPDGHCLTDECLGNTQDSSMSKPRGNNFHKQWTEKTAFVYTISGLRNRWMKKEEMKCITGKSNWTFCSHTSATYATFTQI